MAFSTRGSAMDADTLSSSTSIRLRQAGRFAVRLLEHRSFLIGSFLFFAIVGCAGLADVLASDDPNRNDYAAILTGPSAEHRFGADAFGRDILSRVLYGARVSLRIGVCVVLGTGIAGVLIGTLAGYVPGLDGLFMRAMDGLMAFPGVLLAIALSSALGPSESNVIL